MKVNLYNSKVKLISLFKPTLTQCHLITMQLID